MNDRKPQDRSGYQPGTLEMVQSACLYVATVLGDYMKRDLTIVGGLVPALLIDQDQLPDGVEPHPGTLDLDIGFELAILEEGKYREIATRLREAGFELDVNERGNKTRQRWSIEGQRGKALVDFLIPPSTPDDEPGSLLNIERDLAAIITPGLDLAFRDRLTVSLHGYTIMGEACERSIGVCGPGAYVVLKALALDSRGLPKDAFDLYYVVRNYGSGVEDVAVRLRPLLDHPEAQRALDILERDFGAPDAVGPMRVARFVTTSEDVVIREDVVGFIRDLLQLVR